MSGPYDRPGVRCGRPGSLRIPRIQDKMTRFRAKPASKAPKSRRRGRPNPFALPLTPPENRPSAVPATHLRRPHHSRRTPTPTPILQLRNPTPQRRYGPPLLQGDRHAPESVIGIVGIRSADVDVAEDIVRDAPDVVGDPVEVGGGHGVGVGGWDRFDLPSGQYSLHAGRRHPGGGRGRGSMSRGCRALGNVAERGVIRRVTTGGYIVSCWHYNFGAFQPLLTEDPSDDAPILVDHDDGTYDHLIDSRSCLYHIRRKSACQGHLIVVRQPQVHRISQVRQ